MKKFLKVLFFFCALSFVSFVCFAGYVLKQKPEVAASTQTDDNDNLFTREKILEILSKEALVYYADGQTQLGSLFGREHRLYITIDRVPQTMKDAIVSAEDATFYTNVGVDPKSILRASVHNLFYGTRQGASTITQQTVKNLYGRNQTNLVTKFQEMMNAFKLEKNFTKDQILEFYLNQFHVTGNGRGVGIAAKYYFNKNVEDLTLVEAAFIAGSVKGPEKYNPFTKTTIDSQNLAKANALIRKNYVLDRMVDAGKLTPEQYRVAVKEHVPFNQGKFQFSELAVNQIIQRQLSQPEVMTALGVNTVDEIGTRGFRITTTLDASTQRAATYGLRQNLSRIQMILGGFGQEPPANFISIQKPELYSFYTAKVDSKNLTPRAEQVIVNLGLQNCTVDTQGVNRVAIILDQTTWVGLEKSKTNFLNSLQVGNPVLVSIKQVNPDGALFCDLETRPRVQGGAIAIDKGQILALVGGFSSNEYNRAVFAQRQPGSTFKIPTYYAGLQLGWTVLDVLSNIRDVFPWQKQFYYPRPDHPQTTLETTIVGAGARSENVASIWLMKHLLDKLSYSQYEDLLKFLQIASPDGNTTTTLQTIVNKFNAYPNDESNIREGIVDHLKNDLATDIAVMRDMRLKIFARTLHFGSNFENEMANIQRSFSEKNKNEAKEKDFRLQALRNSLVRWKEVRTQANSALDAARSVNKTNAESAETQIQNPNQKIIGSFAVSEDGTRLYYMSSNPWKPEIISNLIEANPMRPISLADLRARIQNNSAFASNENVYLDGVVPLAMINDLDTQLENKYREVQNLPPLEKLFWNADFRYSLGMYYTANMLNNMGVNTPLSWVPSFPLGSNTISLAELSLIYQTFLTGKTYQFYNNPNQNQLAIIKRVEDSNGRLLWEFKSREFQYIDPAYSAPIMNVLRSVVLAGTAYSLNWDMILHSTNSEADKQFNNLKIRVPVFGKTGTTNDYTNGTYVGFIPYPVDVNTPLSANNAITIAAYIGYDTNESMQRRGYRVYGGAAIPAWEEIATSIVKSRNFADKTNWQGAEQQEHVLPFNFGDNLVDVTVPVNSGVSVSKYTSAQDDGDLLEKNIYLNDYSDTGQNFLRLYLNGEMSDNIFIPKRKVSFYNIPFSS